MKGDREMKKLNKHFWDKVETGCAEYPKYHLTHYCDVKGYTAMVMGWDTEKDVCRGWFPLLTRETISEARKAVNEWFGK
jgi:hypothetical protein